MRKIRITHIVKDDKFIDGPLSRFEEDSRFENQAVLIVDSSDYKFKYIKNTDRIKLLYSKKMVRDALGRDDYDAVMFYSLTDYHIFKYIPQDKIVIWWAWGWDIYGSKRFIDIPLYKLRTKEYLDKLSSSLWAKAKAFINTIPAVRLFRDGNRDEAIKRIDFFQPVIHTEYELMQKCPGFRAKEFYYPRAHFFEKWVSEDVPVHGNSIIINHSATYTANHLDVWHDVRDFIPSDVTVYFPINYGRKPYADMLSKMIVSNDDNICFLKEFLPREEYFRIVESCSYAVFGVLREAAMGNIYRCIVSGVKLFLYKDSLVYQYLSELGCVVYAIEEIGEGSFKTPLTRDQIDQNLRCLQKVQALVEKAREDAIGDIFKRLALK